MQRFIAIITIILLVFCSVPVQAQPTEPEIDSPAVILMDSASGNILYEKNANEKMYPASITKIMTAIIAIENGKLDDIVTASFNAVHNLDLDSSHIGILTGEQLSLNDLLYGLLVASANESANVIAEHIAGGNDEFIKLMNEKAIELGATNTHFTNTNGLHDENHYTTAYDMAIITQYAMKNPTFREIVKTDTYEIAPTNKYKKIRYLTNTNHLVNVYRRVPGVVDNYYKNAIGVKTGWTSKAQHTLVAAANKDGLEYITVVLGAKKEGNNNYSYIDTINLFEYAFNHFSMKTVAKDMEIIDEIAVLEAKKNEHVILKTAQPVMAILPNDIDDMVIEKVINTNSEIMAPIQKGDVLGSVAYVYNGSTIGKASLVADRNVERDPFSVIKNKTIAILNLLWVKIIGGIIIALLVLKLLSSVLKNKRNRRRNRGLKFKGQNNKTFYIRRRKRW